MEDIPYVVVNPKAANGSVGRSWEELAQTLRDAMGDFEHVFTEGPTHAADLARSALEKGYRNLGSLGGDGTHSQVINGFFADQDGTPIAPSASLTILPIGTGGDFRRMLGIPSKALDIYARHMRDEVSTPIDVGHIRFTNDDGSDGSQYFLNVASFGLGGRVSRVVNASSKRFGGKLTFLVGTIRAMFGYDPANVTIKLDGEVFCEDVRALNVAVCNGGFFGGGMNVAPDAALDDGRFDVVLMPWRRMSHHLLRGTAIYSGKHLNQAGVEVQRAQLVEATAKGDCLLDLDGESPGRLPATFRLFSGALRLKGLVRAD